MAWFHISCPFCQQRIPLSAVRCPACRALLPHESGDTERRRILLLAAAGVLVLFLLLLAAVVVVVYVMG